MGQLKIRIDIYRENGVVDVDSLIGDIEIGDGYRAIVEDATFLDAWFYALVHGLAEIRVRHHCEIDLIDEPDPLIFDLQDGKLAITYKDMTVVADSVEDFAVDLRGAASSLLKVIEEECGNESTEMLQDISRFAGSQSSENK